MWYVVQTVVGREKGAIEKCRTALDESVAARVFTPRCQILKKFHGEWQSVEQIAFQGYVFLESESPKELEKSLMRIPSVVTPVRIGGGFYPIREDEEAVLRQMMDEDNCIRTSEGYLVDKKLVIEKGPLQPFTEMVKKIDRHKRTAMLGVRLFEECRDMRVGLSVKGIMTGDEYRGMMESA